MSHTVISYGEILWDLLPGGRVLGGAPFNLAARVNGLGLRGVIVSRLGRDEPGREAFRQAAALGLETAYLQWDDSHPTGTVRVSLDEARNPDFYIVPGVAYDWIEPTAELIELAAEAPFFCFGTLVQRAAQSRKTLMALLEAASNSVKFLDINLRRDCYTPETVKGSLERADILKLNESEARELAGMLFGAHCAVLEFCERMLENWDLKVCLVTFGANGAFGVTSGGERVYEPSWRIRWAPGMLSARGSSGLARKMGLSVRPSGSGTF